MAGTLGLLVYVLGAENPIRTGRRQGVKKMRAFFSPNFWKFLGSLLPLGFPGGNQVDGSPPAVTFCGWGGGASPGLREYL